MTRVMHTSLFIFAIKKKISTESEAEESGDEGADGPDEEPPVGHQRHAHDAQMTRKPSSCLVIRSPSRLF